MSLSLSTFLKKFFTFTLNIVTSTYQKLRFLLSNFSLKHFIDPIQFNRKVNFLFACSRVDRTLSVDGHSYSRILDPISWQLEKLGFSVEHASWDLPSGTDFYKYKSIRLILLFRFLSSLFLKELCKPDIIVLIGMPKIFTDIASSLGIKVIEAFHGYGIPSNCWGYGVHQTLPMACYKYIVFDDQTLSTLLANEHVSNIAVRCKHPYLLNHEFLADTDTLGNSRKSIDHLLKKASRQCKYTALLTLQHGYEGTRSYFKGILLNGLIHKSLIETIRSRDDIFWILRFHPVQIGRSEIKKLTILLENVFLDCQNVSFDIAFSSFDILDLLAICHFHVTMMSGTITEAAMMNIPSLALCPTLNNPDLLGSAFKLAADRKLLFLCKLDQESINKQLKNILNHRQMTTDPLIFFHEQEAGLPKASDWLVSLVQSTD